MTDKERNEITKQYYPLITKLTNQYLEGNDSELVRGAAEYGFSYALNTYKEGTSQSFLQYAAWCMRNFILNDIKAYSSVVRNEPNSQHYSDCEEFSDKLAYEDDHYTDDYDRIVRIIREKIEAKYNLEKCEMLYHSMALFGYKKMTLKELSIQYGISQPGIKQMNDRIISYIRSDEELLQEVKELCLE